MDEKTQKRNLIFFPIGTIGRDVTYNLVTNYLFTFILFAIGPNAKQLAAITAIMFAMRIFDAINDPIMGNIIDRTRTKWGKFKPWLVIGILTTSVVVYLAFNTTLRGWSFVWFFGIVYFLYSITYTMHDISYWGMIPALSKDANARNQYTSRTNLCAGIGVVLATVLIPLLTTGSNAIGGSATIAYGRIALIVAIATPLILAFTIFGVKEDLSYNELEAPKISFKKIVSTILGNDQIRWISIIFLFQQIGNDMLLGGIGATYIYLKFGYSGGLFSIFSTIGLMATGILMVTYPAISRRLSRKKLMDILMLSSLVGYVIMLIGGVIGINSSIQFWIITIGYMVANLGQYGFYLIMMISIINTVEYNEYVKGERNEAIIASIRPFFTKFASAIVVVITAISYRALGVLDITNKISEYENQAAAGTITEDIKATAIDTVIKTASNGQTLGLLIAITILPLIFMGLSYYFYKKKYTLDEEEYDRICAELEAKKKA